MCMLRRLVTLDILEGEDIECGVGKTVALDL